jgi:hypothetical protein
MMDMNKRQRIDLDSCFIEFYPSTEHTSFYFAIGLVKDGYTLIIPSVMTNDIEHFFNSAGRKSPRTCSSSSKSRITGEGREDLNG